MKILRTQGKAGLGTGTTDSLAPTCSLGGHDWCNLANGMLASFSSVYGLTVSKFNLPATGPHRSVGNWVPCDGVKGGGFLLLQSYIYTVPYQAANVRLRALE